MDEFIKMLDVNLDYVNNKIIEDICYITIISNKKEGLIIEKSDVTAVCIDDFAFKKKNLWNNHGGYKYS